VKGQSGEVAELDEFTGGRIDGLKLLQGFVESLQHVVTMRFSDGIQIQCGSLKIATSFKPFLAASTGQLESWP